MSREAAVLFCPGRGSYGKEELGFLARTLRPGPVADALALADEARARDGLPALRDLDAADRFRPGVHLDGRNAAELILFCTLADAEHLREQHDVVAVAGNSLGWYSALAVAGSVTPADGWRLVSTMARLQELAPGGQVLTTTIDADKRTNPALVAGIDDALASTNALGDDHFVARSIRLGGHEVLAGTEAGVRRLLEVLPQVDTTSRTFPFRLAGHGPFHTRLCAEVAARAAEELRDLPLREPSIHLIDGRGNLHTPWSSDPMELLHYTTETQVVTTFDFTASVRTAIREFSPDVVLCAGPGSTLRAPIAHVRT